MAYYLIMPIGLVLLVLFTSFIFLRRFPRLVRLVLLASLVFLYLMSTRFGVYYLGKMIHPGEVKTYPALSLTDLPSINPKTTAIVILGAGRYAKAPSYGGRDIASNAALVRLRYAARLHKKTGAPILLTGNSGGGSAKVSEAKLMQEVLNEDFGITENIWLETKSASTFENAEFSVKILKAHKINTIILVSHRGHMPRAVKVFEQFPFKVIPAPLGVVWKEIIWDSSSFVPVSENLVGSTRYWHQFLAKIYYQLSGKF